MAGELRVTILGAAAAVAAFGRGGSKCYAQSVGASANLNADIDVNALTNMIQQAIVSAANREGVVKSMMEAAYYQTKQRYNVMVFNLKQNYDSQLSGVKSYTKLHIQQDPLRALGLRVGDVRQSGRRRLPELDLQRQFQTERQPNRGVQQNQQGRIRKVNRIRKVKEREIDRTFKEGEVVKFDNSATARPRASARRGG